MVQNRRPTGYWAFLANPGRYRIEDAVRDVTIDTWTTKGRPVRSGDRVLIWKAKGRSPHRGIVAFGEVISDPEDRLPATARYWVDPAEVIVEPRVHIRYVRSPRVPVWSDTEGAELLDTLPVARSRGGSVFALTTEQWETALALAGGWPDDAEEAPASASSDATASSPKRTGMSFDPTLLVDARERVSRTVTTRQGQPQFRGDLIDAYDSRCAITGCAVTELLEAAHIVPYMGKESNDVCNGLLLRADIHALFDLGFLTIDPTTWTVTVASVLAGSEYSVLAGSQVRLPADPSSWPNAEALRFRAAMPLTINVEHIRR